MPVPSPYDVDSDEVSQIRGSMVDEWLHLPSINEDHYAKASIKESDEEDSRMAGLFLGTKMILKSHLTQSRAMEWYYQR
jgi:hypothetical protein